MTGQRQAQDEVPISRFMSIIFTTIVSTLIHDLEFVLLLRRLNPSKEVQRQLLPGQLERKGFEHAPTLF